MKHILTHIFIIFCVLGICLSFKFSSKRYTKPVKSLYKYDTLYYTAQIDHFSFTNNGTFNMKYLLNTDNWKTGGPILFYTGNEGAIEAFAENTGLMWEFGVKLNAAIIFAEHRYYGNSLPYGNISFKTPEQFGYLTAEQALADFACLLRDFKENNTAKYGDAPVIAFGGSYGGMLAAWFRQKYPNIVAGSIAASAPIFGFPGLTDCSVFSQITTNSYLHTGSKQCVQNIQQTWTSMNNIAIKLDGLKFLSLVFKTCEKITGVESFIAYMVDYLGTIAMVNYPYEADFLGKLPPWPVKAFCSRLSVFTPDDKDEQFVMKVAEALLLLANYSGNASCLDWSSNIGQIDANGWWLQTCMEMTMPMCSNGQTDMFPPSPWDINDFSQQCRKVFNVEPRLKWAITQFWAKHLPTLSNVVFSNGGLDPWSGLGVLQGNQAPQATVLYIPNGAHHLDLRAANPQNDPADVTRARQTEMTAIRRWIAEWKSQAAVAARKLWN